jgi:hypothetical protein
MSKSSKGSRGRGRVLKVGGTEVRLIKAHKKTTGGKKTIRQGAVVVPTDNYDAKKFPEVEQLRQSIRG